MILQLLAQEGVAPQQTFWNGNAMNVLGIWAAVGFSLALYTFLYKDNPVFKFAEHVYVGVTNGWLLWQAWFSSVKNDLVYPLGRLIGHDLLRRPTIEFEQGDTWWLLVPAALSLFMLLRFIPKAAWLSRWSFAFIVGSTAGVLIPLTVQAQIFQQMSPMLKNPLIHDGQHFSFMGTASAFLTIVGVLAVLIYFVFSIEHKGPVKHVARTGIIFLMIAFGAHFGYTVMGRESLLIERIQFLIGASKANGAEGEANPHHATIWLLALVILAVAALEAMKVVKDQERPPEPGA